MSDTTKQLTSFTTEERLKMMCVDADPTSAKKNAIKALSGLKESDSIPAELNEDFARAMSLNEFDNGVLLSSCFSNIFKTLAIDLMRKFQQEYECTTFSERATAEMAALSYVRTLETQRRITNYLDKGTFTDIGVQYLSVLGKELDRANRHYLTAVQALRMLKQPPMQLNIKTNTAVFGQNQVVQTKNDKPI
jgi:hypothetical protein